MLSRPVSAVGYRRPLSQHARVAMVMRPELRYKVNSSSRTITEFSCILGTNKVLPVLLGTNKVLPVLLGTNKVLPTCSELIVNLVDSELSG